MFFVCLQRLTFIVSCLTWQVERHRIFCCFITQLEASSINKPVVCCVCSRFSLKQQPVTGELHFIEKRPTNIKHAEKKVTEERNCTVPFVGEGATPMFALLWCILTWCQHGVRQVRAITWVWKYWFYAKRDCKCEGESISVVGRRKKKLYLFHFIEFGINKLAKQCICETSTFVPSKHRVQKRDICIFTLLHGPSRFSVRAPPPPPDNKWLANATDESRNESQWRTNLNCLRRPQKDNSPLPHFHPFAKCIVALIHTPVILSFLFHDSHQTNRMSWKGDS